MKCCDDYGNCQGDDDCPVRAKPVVNRWIEEEKRDAKKVAIFLLVAHTILTVIVTVIALSWGK